MVFIHTPCFYFLSYRVLIVTLVLLVTLAPHVQSSKCQSYINNSIDVYLNVTPGTSTIGYRGFGTGPDLKYLTK